MDVLTIRGRSIILDGFDEMLARNILAEIVEGGPKVNWDDIVGQDTAKQALRETMILLSIIPALFTGLRSPISFFCYLVLRAMARLYFPKLLQPNAK
jgi:SpoVK/Ycf46/Vps4 family AAA+-type ATPase